MERGNKHSPAVDEELARQARSYTRGGSPGGSREHEWREPEPAGDDQPDPTWIPQGEHPGGAPAPLTGRELEARSRLGRWVRRSLLPADRTVLVRSAQREGAPEDITAELAALPPERTFSTVYEIWAALGHRNET